MGHGCHDCGSPNSCECREIREAEEREDRAINAALEMLTSAQIRRLKRRWELEKMEDEIRIAKANVEWDIKKKYGVRP